MKNCKLLSKIVIATAMVCAFFSPVSMTKISAAEYTIEFKGGSHGTVDNQKSVSYRLSSGSVFPDEPSVQVESGYVFTGWNKELPEVGSSVSGKQIYVAKYGVVIHGLNYTIRYVDENKVDIATPTTMLGEQGEQYRVRAKNIAGYTYQNAQQSFVLDENNKQIYITYTLTNPEIVTREEVITEEQVVNQVVAGTTNTQNTTNTTNANTNQTTGNNNNTNNENNEVDIPENPQPEANGNEVDIPENPQPEAKGTEQSNMMMFAIAGAGLVVIAAFGFILYKKRKNQNA